jgi:hypothetical protein
MSDEARLLDRIEDMNEEMEHQDARIQELEKELELIGDSLFLLWPEIEDMVPAEKILIIQALAHRSHTVALHKDSK